MSCLDCNVLKLKNKRMFEITAEGRVWPCCHLASHFDSGDSIENDLILTQKFKEDPDWNNMDKNNLKDILSDKMFKEVFPTHENPQGAVIETCLHYCKV